MGIGDDIVPLTHLEFVITTVCTLIGLIMYSLIIGSATGALEMRDARRLERQQVHSNALTIISTKGIIVPCE